MNLHITPTLRSGVRPLANMQQRARLSSFESLNINEESPPNTNHDPPPPLLEPKQDKPHQSPQPSRPPSDDKEPQAPKEGKAQSNRLAWYHPLIPPFWSRLGILSLPFWLFWLPRNLVLTVLTILFSVSHWVYAGFKLVASLAYIGLLCAVATVYYYVDLAEGYDLSKLNEMPERTLIFDISNKEIGVAHGENRRIIENLNEVPADFLYALTLQEDRRFWNHTGVDPIGIMRACMQVLKHYRATQGASTLTMQLAKNIFEHADRSFHHKFLEIALARRIEQLYSKEEIILNYINRIFWGHSYLGLKQAARGYFDKTPAELSMSESALLAAIIKSPNRYSPHKNPEGAKKERNKLLEILHFNTNCKREDYLKLIAEPVVVKKPESYNLKNYALDSILHSFKEVFLKKPDLSEEEVNQTISKGGLRIHSTIDAELQEHIIQSLNKYVEEEIESKKGYPHQTRAQYQKKLAEWKVAGLKESDIPAPDYLQFSCVVISNSTGAILAAVGGRDSSESKFNRALKAERSMASLVKSHSYASFFDTGGDPKQLISDGRIKVGEIDGVIDPKWNPQNSNGVFGGKRPAREGLMHSRNTMSIRVCNLVGWKRLYEYFKKAGIGQKLNENKIKPTAYLGSFEATPLQLASSYTTFANGGVRPEPYLISAITDNENKTIWSHEHKHTEVYGARANGLTLDILQDTTKVGTAAALGKLVKGKVAVLGKTGTSNDYKDAWFCGSTSELTILVWIGFDNPRTIMDRGYGATLALPGFIRAFNITQEMGYMPGAEILRFARNPGSLEILLCKESGKLAHAGCKHANCAIEHVIVNYRGHGESEEFTECTHHQRDDDSNIAGPTPPRPAAPRPTGKP